MIEDVVWQIVFLVFTYFTLSMAFGTIFLIYRYMFIRTDNATSTETSIVKSKKRKIKQDTL